MSKSRHRFEDSPLPDQFFDFLIRNELHKARVNLKDSLKAEAMGHDAHDLDSGRPDSTPQGATANAQKDPRL